MLRIKIFCNFERYIVMADFEIIKCHGSGNDFVMVDTTREKSFAGVDRSAFARAVSDRVSGIGSDGVLYVVRHDDGHYGKDDRKDKWFRKIPLNQFDTTIDNFLKHN